MTYLVIAPKKINNTSKVVPVMMFDDLEAAKSAAKSEQLSYRYPNYQALVKLIKVKHPEAFIKYAELVSEYWQELDWNSSGNSFYVQPLREIEKTLRIRADELVNPESYTD
jgi:hypothetical protein